MKNIKINSLLKGLERIRQATIYSIHGMRTAFLEEAAFRQICFQALLSVILSVFFANTWLEKILLIIPACLCIITELINTAIENIVDLVSPEWNIYAKKAKDLGSAAQFFSQLLLLIVCLSFLFNKIF